MWEAFDRPAPPAGARVHANAGAKESVTIHNVICLYDAVEVLGLPLATMHCGIQANPVFGALCPSADGHIRTNHGHMHASNGPPLTFQNYYVIRSFWPPELLSPFLVGSRSGPN